MMHWLALTLTVVVVVILGIVAIVCSTSNGVDWLQAQWKRRSRAPGSDGRDAKRPDDEGPSGR